MQYAKHMATHLVVCHCELTRQSPLSYVSNSQLAKACAGVFAQQTWYARALRRRFLPDIGNRKGRNHIRLCEKHLWRGIFTEDHAPKMNNIE